MMKPGDMIEWLYVNDLKSVVGYTTCFSSTMKRWIPIDGSMLLISIVDQTIYFLRKEGLFHTRMDEAKNPAGWDATLGVVPRARG